MNNPDALRREADFANDEIGSGGMELGLSGRTAIVCGASAGMGLSIAETLASEGANVAMFARRR